jgi:MFS family permease
MWQRIFTAYRNSFRGLPRNVWLLSLILLVNRSGTMVLPYLSLYATDRLGFEPWVAGWALACYGLGGIVAGLLGGWLTERLGSIRTQTLSFALSAPGFVVVGQQETLAGLCAGLLYLGIAIELMRPAANTATIGFCDDPSQHARALGVNRLAVNIGMSVGPTIGGFLAGANYAWLFLGNAIGAVASLVLTLVLFGWGNGDAGDGPALEIRFPVEPAPEKTPPPPVWRDQPFLVFCLFNMLSAIVLFQFLGTYPLYLKEAYSFREYGIGLLFAVNTTVIILFELVLVNALQRLLPIRVFAWGQLLSCLGFGLLPLAAGAWLPLGYAWCVATMLVLTVGEMLAMPMGAAHVARCSTAKTRGRYMGLFASSFSVAFLAAPLAGTALYQINIHLVWYCCLLAGVVVFFGLLRLGKRVSV